MKTTNLERTSEPSRATRGQGGARAPRGTTLKVLSTERRAQRRHRGAQQVLVAVAFFALAGCRGQTSQEAPVFGIRNMFNQPKYLVQEESEFFPDHRTMRPLVEGVIARDEEVDPRVAQGRLEDQSGYVLEIPRDVVRRMGGMDSFQKRGRDVYGIFCAICHDEAGGGNGMATQRAQAVGAAAFAPPSFHQDRLRHAPDGQIFATITNGKNNMPPYAMQIPVGDRWAVVSYVRVLQLAQPNLPSEDKKP